MNRVGTVLKISRATKQANQQSTQCDEAGDPTDQASNNEWHDGLMRGVDDDRNREKGKGNES